MSSPVVHFEIGSTDSARTADFYRAAFGWEFLPAGSAQILSSGAAGGPTGMLNTLGHPPDTYVMIYVQVDDIDAALVRVVATGGERLVGPAPLPDGRRFAWIKDSAGNTIGLLTPLTKA